MKIIIGLGNPGREYKYTRHNIGFFILDAIARNFSCSFKSRKFKSQIAHATYRNRKVLLVKPQTFMNLSGDAVAQVARYYDIDCSVDLLVVCDDVNLPFGVIRIKQKGSSGGHNGLQSIIETLGYSDFPRLKFGVDKPAGYADLADYVLSDFSRDECSNLTEPIETASAACCWWLHHDMTSVMQKYN